MGGCYRVPAGVHYREFVVIGVDRPEISADKGERLCSTCFTSKERIAEAIQQGPDAEQSTDSESSSIEDVPEDEP